MVIVHMSASLGSGSEVMDSMVVNGGGQLLAGISIWSRVDVDDEFFKYQSVRHVDKAISCRLIFLLGVDWRLERWASRAARLSRTSFFSFML